MFATPLDLSSIMKMVLPLAILVLFKKPNAYFFQLVLCKEKETVDPKE